MCLSLSTLTYELSQKCKIVRTQIIFRIELFQWTLIIPFVRPQGLWTVASSLTHYLGHRKLLMYSIIFNGGNYNLVGCQSLLSSSPLWQLLLTAALLSIRVTPTAAVALLFLFFPLQRGCVDWKMSAGPRHLSSPIFCESACFIAEARRHPTQRGGAEVNATKSCLFDICSYTKTAPNPSLQCV